MARSTRIISIRVRQRTDDSEPAPRSRPQLYVRARQRTDPYDDNHGKLLLEASRHRCKLDAGQKRIILLTMAQRIAWGLFGWVIDRETGQVRFDESAARMTSRELSEAQEAFEDWDMAEIDPWEIARLLEDNMKEFTGLLDEGYGELAAVLLLMRSLRGRDRRRNKLEYLKKYHADHRTPEESRRYYEDNRERILQRMRAYRERQRQPGEPGSLGLKTMRDG